MDAKKRPLNDLISLSGLSGDGLTESNDHITEMAKIIRQCATRHGISVVQATSLIFQHNPSGTA